MTATMNRPLLIGALATAAGLAALFVLGSSATSGRHASVSQVLGSGITVSNTVPLSAYSGPIASSIDYGNGFLHLDPPAAGATGTFGWQNAVAKCGDHKTVCGDYSTTPQVALALATTTSGAHVNSDGSIARTIIDHRLVYAMTWSSLPCAQAGGGVYLDANGNVVQTKVPPTTCTYVDLIDANTGEDLGGSQIFNSP